MSYYTTAQAAAINRANRPMESAGIPMSDELEDIRDLIDDGSIAITAEADDIDSLAKGGGHFTQDADLTTGLTFAYDAGRFHNGLAIVSVAADTILLTASQTNYVEVDRAGTVSANTSGFTSGRLPLYTVVCDAGAITTVTSSKPLMTLIGLAGTVGSMLSTAAATKETTIQLGTISATTTIRAICPAVAGVLTKASIAVGTTIAADDTDYWTIGIVNKGPAGSGTTAMADAADDANSTKATGGSGITGNVKRNLTLHGTPANLVTAAEDVLEITLTKAGSAADLVGATLRLDFTFTA